MMEEFAEAKYMIAKSVRITPKKLKAITKEQYDKMREDLEK